MNGRGRRMTEVRARRWFSAAGLAVAILASIALFAELLAADAPIVVFGHGRVQLLAAVSETTRYAAMSREQIDARHAGDLALWPLVRQSPERATQPLLRLSLRHPLGTDSNGRDVFANLVYGTRTALAPALLAVVLSVLIGALLGSLAGTRGGTWDELVARPAEFLQAFPTVLVVALAMSIAPTRAAWTLVLSVTAVRWAETARVVRVDSLRLITDEPVTAARALGASSFRILYRHIWPRLWLTVVTSALATLPALVALEASLAFLGIGIPSSWGTMLAEGMRPGGSTWSAVGAAGMLFFTVGATRVLADAALKTLSPFASRLGQPGEAETVSAPKNGRLEPSSAES